jgi:hypothetical protein
MEILMGNWFCKNLHLCLVFVLLTLLYSCSNYQKLDGEKLKVEKLNDNEKLTYKGFQDYYSFAIYEQNQVLDLFLPKNNLPYPIDLVLSFMETKDSVRVIARLDEIELTKLNTTLGFEFTSHNPTEFIIVKKSIDISSSNNLDLGDSKMNAYQSFYNWIEYYEKTDGQTIGRGSVKFLEKKSSNTEVIYGSYYLVKYQLYILDEELELFEETPQAGVILQVGNESIIEGISEALHSMRVGEKSRFYIPYFLAFGENGNQYVAPFSHLYMIIEVVEKVETGN